MKKFPVTVLDNFYENPDLVRQFALSLKFNPTPDGKWPGERTEPLYDVNLNFFNTFCNKLFSLFFDFEYDDVNWSVETTFQKVSKFSNKEHSLFNVGWIHKDPCIFSGVIYLNPNPEKNTGTSVYKLRDGECDDSKQLEKYKLYVGEEIDESVYEKSILYNNNKFEESIRVENFYNRIVLFEGGQYHGVPSFYTNSNEPRLTQVFFVHKLTTSGSYPVVRTKVL